jgi:hypothetical protein
MSLLWLDGFDWMTDSLGQTNAERALKKRYRATNLFTGTDGGSVTGRQGGTAIQYNNTGQFIQTYSIQSFGDSDHIYVGYALHTGTALGHNGVSVLTIQRQNSTQCGFLLWGDGTGQLFPGGAKFNTTLRANRWYYVEFHFYIHNTTGLAEFKINGEVIHTDPSADFQSSGLGTGWNSLIWYSHGNGSIIDDLYVCNDQGSDNNTYLGDTRVIMLNPNGDDTTQWTQSGVGGHYEEVDDNPVTPPDAEVWTDDDYIESNTTNNKDLFNYEDLPSEFTGATIKAVQCFSVVKTTNAQVMSFKDICKSGATEVDLSTTTIMWSNWHPVVTIQETDPNTAGAWTPTTVNAALFGVKVG